MKTRQRNCLKATRLRHLQNRRDPADNVILSRNVRLALGGGARGQEGVGALVIGGPGSGKTDMVKANIQQLNSSYLVVDAGGRTLREVRKSLVDAGYDIRCLDTGNPSASTHFNPFAYVESAEDVTTLVDCLIGRDAESGADPHMACAHTLMCALVAYMREALPQRRRNFRTLREMLRMLEPTDEPYPASTPLDVLFSMWETGRVPSVTGGADSVDDVLGRLGEACAAHPDSPAVSLYRRFRAIMNDAESQRATLVPIEGTLAPLDDPDLLAMTDYDELCLLDLGGYREEEIPDKAVVDPGVLGPSGGVRRGVTKNTPRGQRKVAAFLRLGEARGCALLVRAAVHVGWVGLLRHAASAEGGVLPVPAQLMLDEVASIGRLPVLAHGIAADRGRGVSVIACARSRRQLEALYGSGVADGAEPWFHSVVTLDNANLGEDDGVSLGADDCLVTLYGTGSRARTPLPCRVVDKKAVPRRHGGQEPVGRSAGRKGLGGTHWFLPSHGWRGARRGEGASPCQ